MPHVFLKKISIENAGVSGSTGTERLVRIDNDVIARKPDSVYIVFGLNDTGRRKRMKRL